jgi:DNA-damage-inducible protein J
VLQKQYIGIMNKSAVIHARIEPGTKLQAERILHKLGLSPTEAIRMFYRQIALRRGLPFSVEIPNALTRDTIEKSRKGEDVEAHNSLDSMFESWKQ